jgi:phosphoglycolate phosphatase-like HAD superfamily hydrolase
MTQALLFDRDGTLIDSFDNLTRAERHFRRAWLGRASREEVEPLIGRGAPALSRGHCAQAANAIDLHSLSYRAEPTGEAI